MGKAGQTPAALWELYPSPSRPSLAEPPTVLAPSAEFTRHSANAASSGRMSVAATVTKLPPVKMAWMFVGRPLSGPHKAVEIWSAPAAERVAAGPFALQWGCAK